MPRRALFFPIFVALLALPAPALGTDTCRERFARYLMGTVDGAPGQARISIQMGATSFENEFLFISQDHNLFRPIRPAGQPWILVFNGGRYQSTDRGGSWSRLQSFDPSEARARALAEVGAQVASATDVICGEDVLDGVAHDTFEATLAAAGTNMQNRYWVSRSSRTTTRTLSTSRLGNATIVTTQEWRPAPNLSLPSPR
jgi:hypothetical protein